MDWLGVTVLAVVTAVGGGTVRDMLLGRLPVDWIQDPWPVWVALGTAAERLRITGLWTVSPGMRWWHAARMDTHTDVTVPRPPAAGPEMEALSRFYPDVTWKGVIHAGGMGPGSPAMTGIGRSTSRVIQDGRWIVTDSEQEQFLEDGTFVLKWQLHWVSGWDPGHGEYRAVMADNYGHTDVYRGRIDGDRLVFESLPDTGPRLRFTWNASAPDVIGWRNEMAVPDGSWFLIEEYSMVPVHHTGLRR